MAPTRSSHDHLAKDAIMKSRSVPLPVLVVITVVALMLGTLGTAVATPVLTERAVKKVLTERAVKKIAAKVVRKKAHRLKVKDAKALGGLPPSAYQTTVFTAGFGPIANAATFDKTLPAVPPGTYQASVYLTAAMSLPTSAIFCTLYQAGVEQDLIDAYGADYTNFRTVAATRTVTLTGTGALHLFCRTSSGTITAVPANPMYAPAQVTLLKVDNAPYLGTAPRTSGRSGAPSGAPLR